MITKICQILTTKGYCYYQSYQCKEEFVEDDDEKIIERFCILEIKLVPSKL
jgi:hypothetical protein